MGRRGPKRRLTDDALLEAAVSIVATRGLPALTLGSLSTALGVSVSGLYRYFPNKQAILVALQERAIEAYRQQLETTLADLESDPEVPIEVTRLMAIIDGFGAWLELVHRAPAWHRLIDALLSAQDPVLTEQQARHVDTLLTPIFQRLDGVIDEAVTAGVLQPGPARQRTHLLWAALHGLDHFRKRDRIQPPLLQTRALVLALFETFLLGWGAPPNALATAMTLCVQQPHPIAIHPSTSGPRDPKP